MSYLDLVLLWWLVEIKHYARALETFTFDMLRGKCLGFSNQRSPIGRGKTVGLHRPFWRGKFVHDNAEREHLLDL